MSSRLEAGAWVDCTAFHGVGTRQGEQSWGSSPGAGLVLLDGRGAARLRGRTQPRPAGGGRGEAAGAAPFRAGQVMHLQPGRCRQSVARGAHRQHPWHLRFSPAFPQWMGQQASTPPAAKLSRSIPNARALRRAVSLAHPPITFGARQSICHCQNWSKAPPPGNPLDSEPSLQGHTA